MNKVGHYIKKDGLTRHLKKNSGVNCKSGPEGSGVMLRPPVPLSRSAAAAEVLATTLGDVGPSG